LAGLPTRPPEPAGTSAVLAAPGDLSGLLGILTQGDEESVVVHGHPGDGRDQDRAGRAELLIATDLAARGLDIEDVDYVVQLDLPEDVRTYRHRAGRTARAGKAGAVISLTDEKEIDKLKALAVRMEMDLRRLPRG